MKKIAICFMVVMMFWSSFAFAENVDLASMTLDELVQLYSAIRIEINTRIGLPSSNTIGRGSFVAGETIYEGTYDFVCTESGVFSDTGYVNNQITVTNSEGERTFRASKISVGGHVTFTLTAGDTLEIAGCSGTLTVIVDPIWVP